MHEQGHRFEQSNLADSWFTLPSDEVVDALASDVAAGLTRGDAAARLAVAGPNLLAEPTPRPRWRQFLDQFRNLLVGLLIVGAVIAAAVGDVKDSVAIAVVLVLNASLGYVQERRAATSLQALRRMLLLRVRVRRDGEVVEVNSADLVPGDVVMLEAGNRVPADGRVVEAWSAEIDESSLTGESVPVGKTTAAMVAADSAIGDRVTAVFMNTQVTQGRLVFVVVKTGMGTQIGQMAELIASSDHERTPLQSQLDQLGKRLAALSGAVVALYFVLGLLRGLSASTVLISSVALIVAAIPEGLPAVVTLTLAVGTHRLAQRGAIVKRLASVETLGSTSTICSDKTGTLTLNQMTARALYVDGVELAVSGEGYDMDGTVAGDDQVDPRTLIRVGYAAALCNDSHVTAGQLIGDPTEGALVVLAAKLGVDPDSARADSARVAEVPFESARRLMATFHRGASHPEEVLGVVKGAWEVIVPRSTATAAGGHDRPLTDADRADIAAAASAMAARGLRVLALASRRIPSPVLQAGTDDVGALLGHLDELTLLGLVGLLDPPRPEAIAAVARCQQAGITVKMVTGDHVETATAIAAQIGITGGSIEGRTLETLDDEQLSDALVGVDVIARVSSQVKVRVVNALRRRGEVVAMTGDGVNDAAALVAADIGIAMGASGTEVAKDAADMVLADDNFATIGRAVEQGRGIYANIVKFVRFQVATNIGALLTFMVAQLAGLPTPFNPIQILWINLIMDGPPAMALGVDPTDPTVMDLPPRRAGAPILSRHRLSRIVATGVQMAVGTLAVLIVVRETGTPTQALTAAFCTFVFFQVANALNVRAEHHSIFRRGAPSNPQLRVALIAVIALQILVVTTPIGHRLFTTTRLSPHQWLLVIGVASCLVWFEEIYKLTRIARPTPAARTTER